MKTDRFPEIRVDPNSSLPLYAQIRQQITWFIASGRIQAGDLLPPIRTLAAELKINLHTVRSAYQLLEQDRLVTIRRGGGTSVLPFDPSMITHLQQNVPNHTIGVLIPGLANFYMPFLRGVENLARSVPALVMIANAKDSPENARMIIYQMMTQGVDGIIVISNDEISDPPEGLPIVYADPTEPVKSTVSIMIDSFSALYQTTRHMLWHGYKDIMYLTAPLAWGNVKTCHLGFQKAIAEAEYEVYSTVVEVPGFDAELACQAVYDELQTRQPDAIVACADILAIGAIRAVKTLGLSIPDDIGVIGYNNIDLCSLVDPELSSATLPIYEMGEMAMKNLVIMINGEKPVQKETMLPVQLVLRQSCGCSN